MASDRTPAFFKHINLSPLLKVGGKVASFSPLERALFALCAILMIGSTLFMVRELNSYAMSEVPTNGGTLREGIVGSPRFINPVLATSDADRDLTSLVYSGLMKATPIGTFVPDLAEKYEVSDDGLTYTFYIRKNAKFHDGTPVTAADVVYTVEKAQDPAIKSPRRASWEGIVAHAESDLVVTFTLKHSYGPFLENTTLGILPSTLWKDLDAEEFPFGKFNTEPIGSGPYEVRGTKQSRSGVPLSYDLNAYANYALGRPHISHIDFFFYPNEDALLEAYRNNAVDSISGISPDNTVGLLRENSEIKRSALPRIFAVFLNQSQSPALLIPEVREALIAATDQDRIIKEALDGFGTKINGPLPAHLDTDENSESKNTGAEAARDILANNGWTFSEEKGTWSKTIKKETVEIKLSLSTSNAPELKKTAELIKEMWESAGIPTDIKLFDVGELTQSIIRPRKYDALLFGEILGRQPDLFAFWHSSQRNDPGLNIALYANISADKLLEEARETLDPETTKEKYIEFEGEVQKDNPAVFLYSPDFIYVVPKTLKGASLGTLALPSDRFLDVENWYLETDTVWNVFLP